VSGSMSREFKYSYYPLELPLTPASTFNAKLT
jgi:hypothetical protein